MQYVPFKSDIEIPFYASLASRKINHDMLDDSARKVLGLYEIKPADAKEYSCRMQIHGNALSKNNNNNNNKNNNDDDATDNNTHNEQIPTGTFRAEGTIKNVNTMEEYRNLDKNAMLQSAGQKIWDAINDGSIYSNPSLLASFLILSYADLKKYRFSYRFAFPALAMEPSWSPVVDSLETDGNKIPHKKLSPTDSSALVEAVQAWRESSSVDPSQHGFFLAKKSRKNLRLQQVTPSKEKDDDNEDATDVTTTTSTAPRKQKPEIAGYRWLVGSLAGYENGFFEGEYSDDCYVCFADPSNYAKPGPVAPGWMLRNLLALARQRWKRDRVQILCYRETASRPDAARSVILDLEVPFKGRKTGSSTANAGDVDPLALPKVVGWERNSQGKLSGRMVDLTEYMDPTKLADSSVDLNLKLMKWRISPNLNLDVIKSTKCLLLGAGTLGSYISRNLMGWGVRKITFVDYGSVSFSNPVRQPLFTFKDCLDGGKKKATCAAEALREIYPGVESEGHVMSVPMAGHPVTDAQQTKADFEKLKDLIDQHDAIFLLMDTRESRWLPTVMAKAANKIVINSALGFDTYVVMRHGVKPTDKTAVELGCYYCNDVVAPVDSMKDLTLDQQCTVTRPGIAAIASALAVELLISILQHPARGNAPAAAGADIDRGDHPLGIIPHQIRGFLSNFNNVNIVGRAYDCCSACSDKIVGAYKQDGWTFVEKALNDTDFVEELSGLKEVQRAAEAAAADIDFDEDEDEDGPADDEEGELI